MLLDARNMDYAALNEAIRQADEEIEVVNCLGQRFIGTGSRNKNITIHGITGNALGAYLNGAESTVYGNAQDATGDTMNEGLENKLVDFMVKHNIKYPLAQGYGMSEVSAAASFCVNNIYKRGSVGIPSVTTTVSIFDPDTQKELGYNEIGEVCITGPSMMKGYFKRPEETAHVMRKHDDGLTWVHSGDLGYIDNDGFLFIVGRVKRMITRFDGHKVFPVNIESLVSEREDVHNCSAIGVRDREHMQGHYPMVVVEFKNVEDKEAVCKEIYQICLEKLEERGQPVAVVPIDKVPITGAGKNDYRTLEKEYLNFDYLAWQAKL